MLGRHFVTEHIPALFLSFFFNTLTKLPKLVFALQLRQALDLSSYLTS